ncbi:MAG: nickel pincer cofactor biosynthesis protein LarC [Candidatus Hodarchaeota archaeon]
MDLINSGISGDMLLSALLGLVSEPLEILRELQDLKDFLPDISKLDIKLIHTEKTGIQLNQLKIELKETKDHRSAKTLKKSLNDFLARSKISDSAKIYANNVLNSLIQAEVEVHGKLIEHIHLHELSSSDTLIDILGVSTALDRINGFNKDISIFCSKIPMGSGTVNTKHGVLAIPAPATLKILEKSNLITYGGPIDSELVTPTGAALLTNLKPKVLRYPTEMTIRKSVYSTGQKKFKNFLNILRIFYGEHKEIYHPDLSHPLQKYVEQVSVLETDVDDVSGEILGNIITKFEKEGILDIQVFPSITKKNRPGHLIKILCYPEHSFKLIEKLIHELGTLGVRFNIIDRVCVNRENERSSIEINGKVYDLSYKISFTESDKGIEIVNIKPEYEDLKRISENTGLTVKNVQLLAQAKIQQIYDNYRKLKENHNNKK